MDATVGRCHLVQLMGPQSLVWFRVVGVLAGTTGWVEWSAESGFTGSAGLTPFLPAPNGDNIQPDELLAFAMGLFDQVINISVERPRNGRPPTA